MNPNTRGQNATLRPGRSFPEWPVYDDREINAVERVIRSRKWWRIAGNEVTSFEREFADYQRAHCALAVSNGTVALELTLAAADIGFGDEVIVPAFTFASTATAVLCAGAIPVFADVDPATYCISAESVSKAVSPRTKAIIPVHMAGQAADMDEILAVAERHKLLVIEDCAHAHGAEWKNQRLGTLGKAGIFSYQSGKVMTAGEGGSIVSNDTAFIERCFLYGNCGRPKEDTTYQHALAGSNCRLPELQAAVLRVQLTRLDEQISTRTTNSAKLDAMLSSIPGIKPQICDPRTTRNPHYMYMFRYDPDTYGGLTRSALVDSLVEHGVPAFVGYPALHRLPMFHNRAFGPRWKQHADLLPDYSSMQCEVSKDLGDHVVWFHHRVLLGTEEDLRVLVEVTSRILDQSRAITASVA